MGIETFFEFDTPEGLEHAAAAELRHRFADQVRLFYPAEHFPGTLQFAYGGSPHNLLQMKTALSLFWVMRFPIPRPKALLGHQNLTTLFGRVDEVIKMWPKEAFKSLYIAASGSESAVMQRIGEEIAAHARLAVTRQEGDLLVRLRRPLDGSEGWEAAVRMSPRPLSVRPWRACDWKGGLNAAVAQAMVQLSQPRGEDAFLNIACGSGTLLLERAAHSPARLLIGCDTDPGALECARQNVQAAKHARRIQLEGWDARSLPLADASMDVICADLPFGHDVGSHKDNLELYPALLQEAARVARPGARCVLLSHEVRLMTGLLEDSTAWVTERILPITITGLHPRIYLLKRNEP